jgi:hypothetical protein
MYMSFATNHFIKNMINNAATAPNIDDIALAYRNIYTHLGFDYKGRGNFIIMRTEHTIKWPG